MPVRVVFVTVVAEGILARTARDLNAVAFSIRVWTDFDFQADRGYKVASLWPRDLFCCGRTPYREEVIR